MIYTVFDIETAADEAVVPLLEPPSPPANYKDPEKIAAWQADAVERQRDSMALKPSECRIIAFGIAGTVQLCPAVQDERNALTAFWDEWRNGAYFAGFNCLGFDLPVIIVRSKILGVPVPNSFTFRKYGTDRFRDLMLELDPGGNGYHSLSWWCKRLGLDVPDDPSTGAAIAGLLKAGDWPGIEAHCKADLMKTHALLTHMG